MTKQSLHDWNNDSSTVNFRFADLENEKDSLEYEKEQFNRQMKKEKEFQKS